MVVFTRNYSIYWLLLYLYMSFLEIRKNPIDMMNLKRYLYIALICMALKIILTIWQYTHYEILFVIIRNALLFLCWRYSRSIDFIINFLLLVGVKNMDSKRVIKSMLLAGIIGVVYGLTIAFITNPESISVTRNFGRGVVETRYRFSTWHANTCHLVFTTLITFFLYAYYRSCNVFAYGVMLFINQELFQLTRSRTGLISGIISILMFCILKYGRILFKFKGIPVLFELLNIGVILGSLYFGFVANTNFKWYQFIDGMITGRLSIVKRCIEESGYHLFGSPMGGKYVGMGYLRNRYLGM